MNPRADSAPPNTRHLLYFMAKMAAMKKVLSPISDTMMTEKAATKAWKKPKLLFDGGLFPSSLSSNPSFWSPFYNLTEGFKKNFFFKLSSKQYSVPIGLRRDADLLCRRLRL